jgi:phage replication-related protein YjqB (UPF0714/DUF867 family)
MGEAIRNPKHPFRKTNIIPKSRSRTGTSGEKSENISNSATGCPRKQLELTAASNRRLFHFWQSGQMPKNSSRCVTPVKAVVRAIRRSISPGKHS